MRVKLITNNKGQGLVEYLIIVALIAVATMSILRVMNGTVQTQFARVTRALQGNPVDIDMESIRKDDYDKKDMSDFFNRAGNR